MAATTRAISDGGRVRSMAHVVDDADAYLCSECVSIFGYGSPDITNIIVDAQMAGKEYIICPYCGERLEIDRRSRNDT